MWHPSSRTGLDDRMKALTIAVVHPLLSTAQGDEGNARVLRHRAALRGVLAIVITSHGDLPLPAADIYLLGGLPSTDQPALVDTVRRGGVLAGAVGDGAAILAVNAGLEVLGEAYQDADGVVRPGLGLLDIRGTRALLAEGPVVTAPNPALGLPAMSGYECHTGRIVRGAGVAPLAELELGVGNGDEPRADGVVDGRVIGTYLHGPVLARNPELADLVLGWVLGGPLQPAESGYAVVVRAQRIAEDRMDRSGWAGARH
jgi:lipid II isoglutaminyl synthase (glutamine-hydrolysing)